MSQKGRKSRPEAARFPEFPMNERHLLAAAAAMSLLVVVVTVSWVVLSPGWTVQALAGMAQQQLGRGFSANGDVDLDVSPMVIRIEQPVLAGQSETAGSLMTAKSMVFSISLSQIIARRPALLSITLNEPEFALFVDERGQASWDFSGTAAGQAMDLTLKQGTFRYFDARNGQAFKVGNVDGLMKVTADGGVSFEGTAVINSLVSRAAFSLKSLPRVNADGSPLEIAVESQAHVASFSGRLSTAKVLNLAGSVSISSTAPAGIARMAGIPLAETATLPGPLNLNGALDSAGRAFAIRNAALTFGQFRALGEVVADLRGERPKLQANLEADTLWLDALLPSAGAEPGSWGRAVLPVERLRAIDAEVNILARAARFMGYEAGATRMAATLNAGKLSASGASRLANGGTLSFTATADAMVLPPAGTLTFKAENTELAPLIGALGGVTAVEGTGTIDLDLTAQGRNQEELVSSLKGTANVALSGGRLVGADVAGMLGALRERILDGWTAVSGSTQIDSLSASLTIADGLATITAAKAKLPGVEFAFTGTADLLRRALDVKADILPPETAPLPVAVIVQGNWDAPRIYPDIPDILNNPEGGFARLRTDVTPPGN
jgi:uncharacterized protein involved in outer membrane biogenesis